MRLSAEVVSIFFFITNTKFSNPIDTDVTSHFWFERIFTFNLFFQHVPISRHNKLFVCFNNKSHHFVLLTTSENVVKYGAIRFYVQFLSFSLAQRRFTQSSHEHRRKRIRFTIMINLKCKCKRNSDTVVPFHQPNSVKPIVHISKKKSTQFQLSSYTK